MRFTHLVYVTAMCAVSLASGIQNPIIRIHNDPKAPSFTIPLCASAATGSIKATQEIIHLPQACKRNACMRQFGRIGIKTPIYAFTSFAIASTMYYPTGYYLFKTYVTPFLPIKP